MSRDFLEQIMSGKIAESDTLEFKEYYFQNGKLTSLEPKVLAKLFKEICAFANYNGGKIILGLKEDNNHNPSELSDVGVNKDTFEVWEQSLRNKLAVNIIPSLYGIKTELVEVSDKINCIIIDVPRSILKPHAFNTGSNHEFYIRNGNTSIPMKYNDLRNAFDELSFKQERIRKFIDDRILSILGGDLDESLSYESSLVVHIVPEWSLSDSNFLNLSSIKKTDKFPVFSPSQSLGTTLYNADGLIRIHSSIDGQKIMSYTQVFFNSCIESVEVRLLNACLGDLSQSHYTWNELERSLVKNIYSFANDLKSMDVYGGLYLRVTILNAKNKRVRLNEWHDESAPLIHDLIKTPLIHWNPNNSFIEGLYPLLTTLAHACGLSCSNYYTENGEPIKEKFDFLKNNE